MMKNKHANKCCLKKFSVNILLKIEFSYKNKYSCKSSNNHKCNSILRDKNNIFILKINIEIYILEILFHRIMVDQQDQHKLNSMP